MEKRTKVIEAVTRNLEDMTVHFTVNDNGTINCTSTVWDAKSGYYTKGNTIQEAMTEEQTIGLMLELGMSYEWMLSTMEYLTTLAAKEGVTITQEPLTTKDIEVQETVQQAMELDVHPATPTLGNLCPKCKWLMEHCNCPQKAQEETKLWKFNRITGYWKMERTMFVENAKDWLASFQELYPNDYFKVSKRKPKGMPY